MRRRPSRESSSAFVPSSGPWSKALARKIISEWMTYCRLNGHPKGAIPERVREAYRRFSKHDRVLTIEARRRAQAEAVKVRKANGSYLSGLSRLRDFSVEGLPAGSRIVAMRISRPAHPEWKHFTVELEVPTGLPGYVERYYARGKTYYRRMIHVGRGRFRRPFWLKPVGWEVIPDWFIEHLPSKVRLFLA